MNGYWWSWWCVASFPYRETYADRIVWTSLASLRAGTHTVSYQAVAATRGVFTLPPAYALVEDQPELMGLSQGGTIVVHDPRVTSVSSPDPSNGDEVIIFLRDMNVAPNLLVSPVGCPGGCPMMGVCQLTTGKCICQSISGAVDEECSLQNDNTEVSTTPVPLEKSVAVRMTLQNVDYNKLVANSRVLADFKRGVKNAIIDSTVQGIREEHISVSVSPGSVIVQAMITPPQGIAAESVSASFQTLSGTSQFSSNVVTRITGVAGIDAVTTGTVSVHVSGVTVEQQTTTIEYTTASKASTGVAHCLHISAFLILLYLARGC
jgi:hypothetical protein